MTPDELRAIRDAATPGPWQVHSEGAYYDEWSGDAFWIGKDGKILGERKAWASALTAEDAALIALAPDLASLLADAMEALEKDRVHSVKVQVLFSRFQALREPK